jgi:hypothetical protein
MLLLLVWHETGRSWEVGDTCTALTSARVVPAEVGLFGLGYYTQAIIDLCRCAGMKVVFVVDDRPEEQPGYTPTICLHSLREALRNGRVPVWTQSEFFLQVGGKATLPLLIAARIENEVNGSVSSDPYLRSARMIREVSNNACALFHPVCLADAVILPAYRKRVALFGFPGSGNILAHHLVRELQQRVDASVPPPVHSVGAFATHYYVSTFLLIKHLLRDLHPTALELIPVEFPTMDLTLAWPGDEYALALHIPTNRHLAEYFHPSHAMPSRYAVDTFARLAAPCVAIIRHPCETLLSYATKLSRPLGPMLDRPWLMQVHAPKLAEWHRQLIANEDRFVVLRYEDLVNRQKQPLRALAERLGVPLSDQEIDALYDRYLHRDLLPQIAPGHYFRGGSDKWKQHFHSRHLQSLLAQGFGSICTHWDYDLTPAEAPPAPATQGGPSGQMMGVLPLAHQLEMDEAISAREPFPLIVQSKSRDLNRSIQAALFGQDFLAHLNAGGIGPEPPPWAVPIPWCSMADVYYRSRVPAVKAA